MQMTISWGLRQRSVGGARPVTDRKCKNGHLGSANISQGNPAIGRVSIIISIGIASISCGRFRIVGAMIEIVRERLAIIGSREPYGGGMNAKFWRDYRSELIGGNL
jgi:hypothetical protein